MRIETAKFYFLLFLIISSFPAYSRIRIISSNLTSGNDQSYQKEGIEVLKTLAPDIVLIQEFNYKDNSPKAIKEFVETTFGPEYFFFREQDQNYTIPNGVISRFPIIEAGTWHDVETTNRGFVWGKIILPTGDILYAYSVHFSAASKIKRANQAHTLINLISKHIDPNKNLIVIGGDLNTSSRNEAAARELQLFLGMQQAPLTPDGKEGTNSTKKRPYDYVMTNQALSKFLVPVVLCDTENIPAVPGKNWFPSGLVFDPRQFSKILNLPELAKAGNAENMQHMAVVRDIEISPVLAGCNTLVNSMPDLEASHQ